MRNPFAIFKPLMHVKRPSRMADMPAMADGFWLRRGYDALTFFGTIVTATKEAAEQMGRKGNELKTHEMIHLRQAQSTHDSWLCFYALYIWYYLLALPQNWHMRNAAYLLNPFEMEAYENMYNPEYANHEADGWRHYAKMKPSERLQLYKKQKGLNNHEN